MWLSACARDVFRESRRRREREHMRFNSASVASNFNNLYCEDGMF